MNSMHTVNNSASEFQPQDIEGYNSLKKLALDLLWTWNHSTDDLWEELDPMLWELTNNPWVVLQTVSRDKIKQKLSDPNYRKRIDELIQKQKSRCESECWFQKNVKDAPLKTVAYFSMEFMLSEALPIYSGGLGNVAGDQLKAASDLGVPVIGIGLLYQQGYFRQNIDKDGAQQALYPYNDPGQLPIRPLRKPNGEWLRLEIMLPGYSVWLRVWQVQVGRVFLYLLDSNDAANYPVHRGITSELYGGGSELRLKQEMLLGIGGWRMLDAIGIDPDVCHLNEGHAAFGVLERASLYMKKNNVNFETALIETRSGNLFTTHTAVPAGFDRFSAPLIEQYFNRYVEKILKISMKEFLGLGRLDPNNPTEDFNMAYLAIRGSGSINGVSKLHGKVSRQIFEPLFPRWPEDDVPVGYVTNGVHMPSWDSAISDEFWTELCGKERWKGETVTLEKDVQKASDVKIWQMRTALRKDLIEFTRKRLAMQLAYSGASQEKLEGIKFLFDHNTLTLGFARRFATYKRPNMLLQDPERFIHLLTNPHRPVQLLIAGKAHPADKPGQELIKQWTSFIRNNPQIESHVVFLSDYDMRLTEQLVRGVDVWINTPRRPWEACGTSGMKVLVNGGLNCSELDGWWAEAYTPEVGWALGDGQEHGLDADRDAIEARQLYDLLEQQIVPEFYTRNEEGIPTAWIARIRQSMATLTPRYSANRAVREYIEMHYIPSAKAFHERAASKGAFGKKFIAWKHHIDSKWNLLRFVEVKVKTENEKHIFEVWVYLDDLDPNSVKVEIYANGENDSLHVAHQLERTGSLPADPSTYVFKGSVSSARPIHEYTPRLVPFLAGASVPLEASQILWQR